MELFSSQHTFKVFTLKALKEKEKDEKGKIKKKKK